MSSKQIQHENYKPEFLFLPLLKSIYPDVDVESDPAYSTVVDFVDNHFDFTKYPEFKNWRGTKYHFAALFKAQLLAYALHGNLSLRELETVCKNDVRFLSFFNGSVPCYVTFQKFQQCCLKPHMEQIFVDINRYIEENDICLDPEILYLDGTKFEANANKMTFVWMKATETFRERAWASLLQLIDRINGWLKAQNDPCRIARLKKPDLEFLFSTDEFLQSLEERYQVVRVSGKGHRKHPLQRFRDTFVGLSIRLFKYMIHDDLSDGRNSFSKTDPDATFMHMKYDYYNHTNVFKPGYNVQLGISSGYIRIVHVSQNANDVRDFIPAVDKYREYYGEYPRMVPADAGYGSFDNYSYCQEHGIELMMKYSGQIAESKITEKNRFKSYAFKLNEDNVPVCPAGRTMELLKEAVRTKGVYPQTIRYYIGTDCENCPLMSRCTKSSQGRIIRVNEKLNAQKAIVRENMSTPEGQKIMVARSIQAEGTFGDLKQNLGYDRIVRRGLKNVEFELLLVASGHNFRKFINRKRQDTSQLLQYGQQLKH